MPVRNFLSVRQCAYKISLMLDELSLKNFMRNCPVLQVLFNIRRAERKFQTKTLRISTPIFSVDDQTYRAARRQQEGHASAQTSKK